MTDSDLIPEGLHVQSGKDEGTLVIADAQDHVWVTLHDRANGDPLAWREQILARGAGRSRSGRRTGRPMSTFEDMFRARTYKRDLPLFEKLRLTPFTDAPRGWSDVGVVETDRASVKIEVSALPAQFWRFTITARIEDVQPGVIRTGSGALSDYWPTVELVINGTLQFEPEGGDR